MPAALLGANGAPELIFDWNEVAPAHGSGRRSTMLLDETLREGLQNPSVEDPSIEDKLRILHLVDELGIDGACVGLPGSSRRAFEDVLALCREAASCRMGVKIAVAARTLVEDVAPVIEISQRVGIPIEANLFIGSSPIRQYVEQWDVALIAKRSAEAIDLAVKGGLPTAYVTEDTTRSRPEVLNTLFRTASDHGATRLCLSDTVGHATRDGVRNLLRFTRDVIAETGASVGIDWHGHNDRGLALENALAAIEFGADRVHGTALGLGERVGNAAMELLLVNLGLLGDLPEGRDLTRLADYCETVAGALRWQIPTNHPLVGRDAFRTATGVHAAAIVKAMNKSDARLIDRVYSGVPAGMVGRKQEICIGFMSGASNVGHWLRERGLEPSADLVGAILEVAKATTHILSEEDVMSVVKRMRT